MKNDVGNLAVIPQFKPTNQLSRSEGSLVGMLVDLQTTLDIEQILSLFSGHLQEIVPHDGYGFHNELLNIDLASGRKARNSCVYTLKLEGETLGEWRVSRDRRFGAVDLERVEELLAHLFYPLRNGLRYREAMYYAHTDPLTQVGNRVALFAGLQREVELARRYESQFAVVFLDIDHFKSINDTHGHEAGDAVLRSVARGIKDTVRSTDGVFRYGGEEFVILFNNTPKCCAMNLAERIRCSLASKIHQVGDQALRVTVSLGVALLNSGESPTALLSRADQAMYVAKHGGRNRVEMAAP